MLLLFLFISNLLLFLTPSLSTIPTPSPAVPERKLISVTELCRHGDRTPLHEFPADALPVSKWPEGVGQLTAIGIRAHYELGLRLRARYVDSGFLPASYNRKYLYVRSTDIDRTLMSAISQLTGLYPPGTDPNNDVRVRFGKDPLHENEGGLPHLYQPIPIHTERKDRDQLLLPGNACPRHALLLEQVRESSEFKQMEEMNADYLKQVARIVGVRSMDIPTLETLSDTWTVFQAHSVPLPTLATPDIVEKAVNLSRWLGTIYNTGNQLNRFRAGLLLYEIRQRMQAMAMYDMNHLPEDQKHLAHKFTFFSAHDSTVAATLAAMRVFDGVNPPYNSTIIWELYKEYRGGYLVRVEYNNKPIILPGCSDEFCPMNEYLDSIEDVMIPGESSRVWECLTGWKRYAAMAHYAVAGKNENPLGEFPGFAPTPDPPGPLGPIIVVATIIVLTVAGVIGIIRARARYGGYSRPLQDKPEEARQPPIDNYEGTRILV